MVVNYSPHELPLRYWGGAPIPEMPPWAPEPSGTTERRRGGAPVSGDSQKHQHSSLCPSGGLVLRQGPGLIYAFSEFSQCPPWLRTGHLVTHTKPHLCSALLLWTVTHCLIPVGLHQWILPRVSVSVHTAQH